MLENIPDIVLMLCCAGLSLLISAILVKIFKIDFLEDEDKEGYVYNEDGELMGTAGWGYWKHLINEDGTYYKTGMTLEQWKSYVAGSEKRGH